MTPSPHTEAGKGDWLANLRSPIFDRVRIPGRTSLVSLIERVCAEHGTTSAAFKANRARYPSNEVLNLRRDLLVAARNAGFAPTSISQWFGHRDSTVVVNWYANIDEQVA